MNVIMTRKSEALYVFRRVVILALLLFLLDGYHLTPAQAIRENEQRYSLPDTQLLYDETVVFSPFDVYHLSLSRVEDTLLLTPARFSLLHGWQAPERSPVMENATAASGFDHWIIRTGDFSFLVIFGYVPDGAPIPTFTVEQYTNEWDITTKSWELDATWEAIPSQLIEGDGGSYFVYTCRYQIAAEHVGDAIIYPSGTARPLHP